MIPSQLFSRLESKYDSSQVRQCLTIPYAKDEYVPRRMQAQNIFIESNIRSKRIKEGIRRSKLKKK